jgi:hypothetical protein
MSPERPEGILDTWSGAQTLVINTPIVHMSTLLLFVVLRERSLSLETISDDGPDCFFS